MDDDVEQMSQRSMKAHHDTSLQTLVEDGFLFLDLMKHLNKGFGPLLLVYFLISTSNAMLCYFVSVTVLFHFKSASWWMILSMSSCVFTALFHSLRLRVSEFALLMIQMLQVFFFM